MSLSRAGALFFGIPKTKKKRDKNKRISLEGLVRRRRINL